jgi:glycosyltransferase involved in cell wall biosynthesis
MATPGLPTVTVVVPAFNAEQWVAPTLLSVVAQTYSREHLEIVVVDDGSTDDTVPVVRRVLAPSGVKFAILGHPSPRGPSAARNLGWRHAAGSWIQFLDDDDLLEPSKIERQVAAALQTPDVAVLFSPWGRLLPDGERRVAGDRGVRPSIGDDPLLDVLRAENFMHLSSLLFSRGWLDRVGGFSEEYRLIEDVELLMRLVMLGGRLQGVDSAQPLSWYRQRAGSLARSNERAFVDGCVRNARIAEDYWQGLGELTPERSRAIADVYFMGTRYYAAHDAGTFDSLIRRIYRLVPDFVPAAPAALRALSLIVGYPGAERLAVRYRNARRALRTVWTQAFATHVT